MHMRIVLFRNFLCKVDLLGPWLIQPINGANRSRTVLKKSRSRSIQARKAMIQCKKVRSIVHESKFTGFVAGLEQLLSVQFPSGV